MSPHAPLVIIVGPTASGKTELALRLAEAVGGEIVSGDSQQVYRSMNIGTGKVSSEERARVTHHLIDVVDPDEEMTAARFIELADAAIADIRMRGKPVIVAGGTMLYLRALTQGLFKGPAADVSLRSELSARADTEGCASLWQELHAVDPISSARIHDTDRRRLIRALEVHRLTGVTLAEHHRRHQAQPPRYQARWLGLAPERALLYQRIDARVQLMLDQGWLAEVAALRAQGIGAEMRSQQAIGYRELHAHLAGEADMRETCALIQRNSRRYARRQMSWYRGNEQIEWSEEPSCIDLEELGRYLLGFTS